MRKIARGACPQALVEKGDEWTRRFVESGIWPSWPQYGKRKFNHILHEEGLRSQTQEHCSYCDAFPISPPGDETIDHFRPKATSPHLAYVWENLFYCCTFCQKMKRDQYEDALLKPDEADYEFLRYFQWEVSTGQLQPSEIASPEEQNRAKRTIELLSLNFRHPALRFRAGRDLTTLPECLDDHPYRDYLECALG